MIRFDFDKSKKSGYSIYNVTYNKNCPDEKTTSVVEFSHANISIEEARKHVEELYEATDPDDRSRITLVVNNNTNSIQSVYFWDYSQTNSAHRVTSLEK